MRTASRLLSSRNWRCFLWVNTRTVISIETGEVIECVGYEYVGPIDLACGGPTDDQKKAASNTTALSSDELANYQAGTKVTTPFYDNLTTNPGQDPALAQQYGVQKAQQDANFAGYGDALPSGFATAAKTRMGEDYARTQDAGMLNRQLTGAQGLNPQQSAQTAVAGNQSVMNAPLQNNFWTNLVGGLIAGGSKAATAFA